MMKYGEKKVNYKKVKYATGGKSDNENLVLFKKFPKVQIYSLKTLKLEKHE